MTFDQRQANKSTNRRVIKDLTLAPPALVPKNPRQLTLLAIDPIEMARQLTLMESSLFEAIRLDEFESKNWSKNDPNINTENIKQMIQTTNNVSHMFFSAHYH